MISVVKKKSLFVFVSPLIYMVQKVLFEHPAPLFDDIHECVLEGTDVQLQPATKHRPVLHFAHPNIQRLKKINLDQKIIQLLSLHY